MFKVSNNVTTTTFIVNFEYISYLFTPFSSVFTVGLLTFVIHKSLSEMVVHKKGP